ncbi:MAG: hypothetical protein KF773_05810 [Deltaproteobacteria bacterium]|nr:hypothetical protein [Deltaproteobacteria bacterium]
MRWIWSVVLVTAVAARTEAAPAEEPVYAKARPYIYLGQHKLRLQAALGARGPAAQRFAGRVAAWLKGENIWGFPAWNAALYGALTGDAAACAKAISTVEAQVAAAEAKIGKGKPPEVAGDSYLQVGDMLGDLALVYDWCHAAVTPAQQARWLAYANATLANVWNPKKAAWGGVASPWSGWAIDNPSNNYYYSFLRATMLVGLAFRGESPKADEWLKLFRQTKVLGELVPAFARDLPGGASREGTGYGVAMRRLFELYDFWKASTGEDLAARSPHARASLLAMMHQVVPTLDRVAPTGDHARDSTAALFDYHRSYLQILIALFPKDPLAARARTLLDASSVPQMQSGFMVAYDFLYDASGVAGAPLASLDVAYHAPGIGQVYVRSDWTKSATWLNFTAGPYTESHAHEDQGAILLYKGGWLAHDAVVHSRSGLPQATTAHGLVRIEQGGKLVRQVAETTSKLVALRRGDGWTYAAADVTAAYHGHAAVTRVQRDLVYLAPDVVVVYDRVATGKDTTQWWQLPTPERPAIDEARGVATLARRLTVHRVIGGPMTAYDYKADADFTGGFRLEEKVPGGDNRYLHVLSIDGAAKSVRPSGASGVELVLASGPVVVTFDKDGSGATIAVGKKKPVAVGTGLDTWPELR